MTVEYGLHLLRSGQVEKARELSEVGIRQASANRYPEVYATALCGRAEVAVADGDVVLARRLLTEALGVARRMIHEGLIRRTETALSTLPDCSRQVPTVTPDEVDVELSDRELAVARLLRGDLTQREIADELYIAPSTVKTHIKSIYRKLGVSKRSYAVTRAAELGLFD
ncbi:MAG: LuxR C-terminal-related transcriptional regulator [Actinomycetota bacterium]